MNKAAEGITVIRWTIQPKKSGELPRVMLLDASTPERAKEAWAKVFKDLDAADSFAYLKDDKYKGPFRPESLANTLRQLLGSVGGAKLTFDGATTAIDYDGARYRVSIVEERAPTRETSKGFLEWEQKCELYKQARAGNASAMMALCVHHPGVVAELAVTCGPEDGGA